MMQRFIVSDNTTRWAALWSTKVQFLLMSGLVTLGCSTYSATVWGSTQEIAQSRQEENQQISDTAERDAIRTLLQEGKNAEALPRIERWVQANTDDPEGWYFLGLVHIYLEHYEDAIEANTEAARYESQYKTSALYNNACAYALMGETDQAFAALHESQDAGYLNRSAILSDPDLVALHDDPRWKDVRGFEFKYFEMQDGERVEYGLMLPNGFDPATAYPVLIAFPPGSQSHSAAETGLEMFWGEGSSEMGWIAVVLVKPADGWFEPKTETYALEIMDQLQDTYQVEGDKFHITGCSGGGSSAFHIGLVHAERMHSVTGIPGYPTRDDDALLEQLAHHNVTVRMHVGATDFGWMSSMDRANKRMQQIGVDSSLTIHPDEGHVMTTMMKDGCMKMLNQLRPNDDG